jgi:hypothetical protein
VKTRHDNVASPAQPPARSGLPVPAVALAALAAACATFLLPALDADLPGGSLPWQVAAAVLALAGALRVRRRLLAGDRGTRARLVRTVAAVALLVVCAWVGGIAILWLIWPR